MDILEKFTQYAKENVIESYDLSGVDQVNATEVLKYFFKQGESKYEASKCLLITGDVGTGKTMFLKLIQKALPLQDKFKATTCGEIAIKYNTDGSSCFDYYNGNHWFFDDLGTEMEGSYYGTKVNVMEQLLLQRYTDFTGKGLKTHITTNLTLQEIEKRYGARVFDRLKEMFEIVPFKAKESKRGLGVLKPIKTEKQKAFEEKQEKEESMKKLNSPEYKEELYKGLLEHIEKGVLPEVFPYTSVFDHMSHNNLIEDDNETIQEFVNDQKVLLKVELGKAKISGNPALLSMVESKKNNFRLYWRGQYVRNWANELIISNQI